MLVSWSMGYFLDAAGLGALAFALNCLLRGAPSFLRGTVITSCFLLGKCLLTEVMPMLLINVRAGRGFSAPYVILASPRLVVGIGLGAACGYWLISRISKPSVATDYQPLSNTTR